MGEFFATYGVDYRQTGWVTDKGEFISCSPTEHDEVAWKKQNLPVSEVEKLWVRIGLIGGKNLIQYMGEALTKAQHKALDEWGIDYMVAQKRVELSPSFIDAYFTNQRTPPMTDNLRARCEVIAERFSDGHCPNELADAIHAFAKEVEAETREVCSQIAYGFSDDLLRERQSRPDMPVELKAIDLSILEQKRVLAQSISSAIRNQQTQGESHEG